MRPDVHCRETRNAPRDPAHVAFNITSGGWQFQESPTHPLGSLGIGK